MFSWSLFPSFQFQTLWLERTTMYTKFAFPGILCWFEVSNVDVVSFLRHYSPGPLLGFSYSALNSVLTRLLLCSWPLLGSYSAFTRLLLGSYSAFTRLLALTRLLLCSYSALTWFLLGSYSALTRSLLGSYLALTSLLRGPCLALGSLLGSSRLLLGSYSALTRLLLGSYSALLVSQ